MFEDIKYTYIYIYSKCIDTRHIYRYIDIYASGYFLDWILDFPMDFGAMPISRPVIENFTQKKNVSIFQFYIR